LNHSFKIPVRKFPNGELRTDASSSKFQSINQEVQLNS
jgi:hypothetical protein